MKGRVASVQPANHKEVTLVESRRHLPVVWHWTEMLPVEERKGVEIRGPQGELNRLAGIGDLASRHDELTALHHPLMHNEPANLSRVRVQDYIANRSDGLAL